MCLLQQLSSPTSLPVLQMCASLQPASSIWCHSAQAAALHPRSAKLGAAHLTGKACRVLWRSLLSSRGVQQSMPPAGTVHNPRTVPPPYEPHTMRPPKLAGGTAFTILSWNVRSITSLLAKVGSLA